MQATSLSFVYWIELTATEVTMHAKLDANDIHAKEAHDDAQAALGAGENQVLRESRKNVSIENFELLKVQLGAVSRVF